MYKVMNRSVPTYISSIFNQYRNPSIRPGFHFQPFLIPIRCSERFRKSPIFKAVAVWNDLSDDLKTYASLFSLPAFKVKCERFFIPDQLVSTSHLKLGRNQEIFLNRARVDLLLKARLYAHHFTYIETPNCRCAKSETLKHLFFQCKQLVNERTVLFEEIRTSFPLEFSPITNMSEKLQFLLYGEENMNTEDLSKLFSLVTDYIYEYRS